MNETAEATQPGLSAPPPPDAKMVRAQTVAKGTGIAMFGALAFRVFNYLLIVIIARGFGASLLGVFSFGITSSNLARILALLGLDMGMARYVARYRALQDPASEQRLVRVLTIIVLCWATLLGIGFFFVVESLLSVQGTNDALAATVMRWFAPAVPLGALLMLLTAAADGQRRVFVGSVARDTLQPALAVLGALAVIWIGGTFINAIQTYLLSLLLALLVTAYFVRGYFVPQHGAKGEPRLFSLREIIGYSLPIFPARIIKAVESRLEIFLLGLLATPAEVGIFTATAGTAAMVSFGLRAILRIYMTLAAELHAQGNIKSLGELQNLATRWATVFSLPVLIAIMLLGGEMLAIFGDSFAGYETVLLILALGQFVNAITGPVAATLNMAGFSRLLLINSAVAVSLNVVLDVWLINRYGMLGAAIGGATIMVLLNFAAAIEVQYLLGIRAFGRQLLRPGFAGLVTFVSSYYLLNQLGDLQPLILLIVGLCFISIVFLGSYWLVAPAEDKELALSALARVQFRTRNQ